VLLEGLVTKEIKEDEPFWHNAEKTESEKTYDEFHILGHT